MALFSTFLLSNIDSSLLFNCRFPTLLRGRGEASAPPHPGCALNLINYFLRLNTFICKNTELESDFRNQMLDLFKFLTNPEKIVIKKIGGKQQTCKQLGEFMEVVANALNSDTSLDEPQSLILVNFCLFFYCYTFKIGSHSLVDFFLLLLVSAHVRENCGRSNSR